ncbi:glutaredoxin family protein [Brevibacillus choshinensis]|uniref:Glutaredoxin family protein n=1 Tax=Brevibacillus choshinensis TaxID=54911 RepID=A0ABX7FQX6_BRECH|nr:glutaredoxin family protein [Brevibacillus choshinensis]QRG68641.1 glutaredoxin family protein [Brevibacillus choshinensis]
MAVQQKVVLWGRNGCSFCEKAKAVLEAHNHPYEWIDVEGRDVLRDVLEVKYGTRLIPVVEIGREGKYEALLHTELDRLASFLTNK